MEKEIVSEKIVPEKNDRPVFDEETLANLLEAAYVLQEHNRRKQEVAGRDEAKAPTAEPERAIVAPPSFTLQTTATQPARDDYTPTLAQIVETQHQIQLQHLALDDALSLIAARVADITGASGAGIGMAKAKKVLYCAVAGRLTLPQGKEAAIDKALCAASLRTGHVIRCAHVNAEFLIDGEECRRRGIHSLIVVPVYHNGGIAGALELYYSGGQSFTEQDVHTCQLMAGLITEALARAEEQNWKKSLESERAVMLEALEKLKPNLAALMDSSAAQKSVGQSSGTTQDLATKFADSAANPASATADSSSVCSKCGYKLVGEEQFCGNCGLPRGGDYEPPNMQSKVASLWHMQEAAMKKKAMSTPASGDISGHLEILHDSLEAEANEISTDETLADGKDGEKALVKTTPSADWSSAATAKNFLEQIAKQPGGLAHFWNTRRGDIYLAIAVILVLCVLRWGIWSNHAVGASGNPAATAASHTQPAADANLSLFDRILIHLGLAEAPEPPESRGNPDTQVWVDLQTALYYCPGADLYSKTPKGKLESQREAQLDQFEPASRKACN